MIYKNVLKLCSEKKISVFKLEKECGIGNGTIKGWESSNPRVDNLKKVADYLKVPMEVLLDDPEKGG